MQEPFNPMAEQNALGILWLNEAGCITYANDAVAHLISTGTDTLVGKPIKELIVELHPSAWVELATSISPGESRLLQVTLHKAGHGSAAAEAHVLRLSDKGNRSFAVFLQGIATPVRTEELFRLQHDVIEALARDEPLAKLLNRLCLRIEAIARDLLCSVILVDEHDRVHVVAAPSIPKGYSIAIDGQPIGPKAGSCGTALYFNQPVEVSDIAHDPLWENYRQLVLPIGLVACWSQPITARDGRVLGSFAIYYRKPRGPSEFHRQLVEVCTHLTAIAIERTRMDERLHDLAFHDVLTKLPNRKLLADRGAIALANAAHAQHPVALLHIDLDRFKRINDAHGHAVGDRFLQAYADQLQAAVRKGDTVSRVGNDEFVLVLPRCDGQQAAHLAQRTLDILAEHVILGQKRFVASASIGISLYPDDAKDFQTLLRYAEMAAHQVKKGGGNGYRFFSRELNAANQELAALEQALRGALAARRLSVHYQPKMDLNRESVYGIEALARWNDPQLGMVPPARFIPVAEASGLIHELGRWVLDEACRQLAEWRAEELAIPYVEVNVSAKQLGRKDLPVVVASILQQYGLPPSALILEITESSLIDDDLQARSGLSKLSEIGIKLAVDDFGTGYSSLSYLKRFPVQELKLDQSFVRHLADKQDDRELASAVINIGRALHLTVVAEGVEHQDQLDFLRGQQCNVAQGYYYSRPLPPREFKRWLRSRA